MHIKGENERERKVDGSYFSLLNVVISNWKKISAYVPFFTSLHIERELYVI